MRPWMQSCLMVLLLWCGHQPSRALGYEDVVHLTLSEKAAADSIRLGELLAEGLGFEAGRDTRFMGRTASELIGRGAFDEDNPALRVVNHFHNPLRPWSLAGLPGLGLSSVLWAQDPDQGARRRVGAGPGRTPGNGTSRPSPEERRTRGRGSSPRRFSPSDISSIWCRTHRFPPMSGTTRIPRYRSTSPGDASRSPSTRTGSRTGSRRFTGPSMDDSGSCSPGRGRMYRSSSRCPPAIRARRSPSRD